jgi:L-alanine-DL-glutamate epimerase-like enolase superfamily enzyme
MARIATLADGAGVPLIAHGYSTDAGVAANRHPIAAPDSARRLEYRVEDGRVVVSDRPGLGVTLDRNGPDRYRSDR